MIQNISEGEKALYDNYNALFFNGSARNDALKTFELFRRYLEQTAFNDFVNLISKYDVSNDAEYRLWVLTWKQNYKHIVAAIRLTKQFRKTKYLAEIGYKGSNHAAEQMQTYREILRRRARKMLEYRVEAKAARKAFCAERNASQAA